MVDQDQLALQSTSRNHDDEKNHKNQDPITINDEPIEEVDSFVYLGIHMTPGGDPKRTLRLESSKPVKPLECSSPSAVARKFK